MSWADINWVWRSMLAKAWAFTNIDHRTQLMSAMQILSPCVVVVDNNNFIVQLSRAVAGRTAVFYKLSVLVRF